MPIFEVGYREWDGARTRPLLRWWAITRIGVRLAYRNRILRKLFYFVYAPLLYFGPLFVAIGAVSEPGTGVDLNRLWNSINENFFGHAVARALIEHPETIQPAAWSVVFYFFFAFVQLFIAMIVVAFVGPPLLARDIRSKGFLVYFSKPITVGEYLLGKGGVVVCYVFLVTLVPALLLYGISIGYSQSIGAFHATWDMVPRIFAASICLAVPAALLVLFLSAIVPGVRYAAFGWIAICIFGDVAYRALSETPGLRDAAWTFLLSPREVMATVYSAIFDTSRQIHHLGDARHLRWLRRFLGEGHPSGLAFGELAGISLLCLVGLRRRIAGLLRA